MKKNKNLLLFFVICILAGCGGKQKTEGTLQKEDIITTEEVTDKDDVKDVEDIVNEDVINKEEIIIKDNVMDNNKNSQKEAMLLIETNVGNITVKLYNDTKLHRDNFLKLAKEGFYNGTLFHRVIKDFMIQAGDPESKNAPIEKMLGSGDAGYTIPAEFIYPKYFHKKGVLSAARQGDQVNPEKESSGCQFYIVTGKVYSEAQILGMEQQMNQNKLNKIFNQLAQQHTKEIYLLRKANDEDGLYDLQEKLVAQAEEQAAQTPDFKFTPEQVRAYTTVGGTPHLDNEYTVFGEVTEGMDVVEKIQKVETNRSDRPLQNVVIKTIKVIDL